MAKECSNKRGGGDQIYLLCFSSFFSLFMTKQQKVISSRKTYLQIFYLLPILYNILNFSYKNH
ncbi:hypothetical protein [Ehrlichia canis]|uniref:hypothetical protein n=1 Tax=Ehrlichia canis TaxID=944 RepID=UPI0012DB7B02|nr:hypothetical protein [Ehrlichia canis]